MRYFFLNTDLLICLGQNKNRYVLAYLSWRVLTGLHREITLSMQIPGHTKCLVDAGFSYIKKLYRRLEISLYINNLYYVHS